MQRNNVPKLQNVHKCVATAWEIGTRNVRPIFDFNRIILIVHSTNRLCLNIERLLFSVDNYSHSFESIRIPLVTGVHCFDDVRQEECYFRGEDHRKLSCDLHGHFVSTK